MANLMLMPAQIIELVRRRAMERGFVPIPTVHLDPNWCPERLYVGSFHVSLASELLLLTPELFEVRVIDPILDRAAGKQSGWYNVSSANRTLTAKQIADLCVTVSPEFRILTDADAIALPTILFREQQRTLTSMDLLLSDEDFLNYYPRRMLERANLSNSSGIHDVLLGQRGATHGDYRAMSTRIQQIKSIMRMGSKWVDMSEPQKEALELIATKIGRIIEGDPEFKDHWNDLGGYAAKASEFCRKESTSA